MSNPYPTSAPEGGELTNPDAPDSVSVVPGADGVWPTEGEGQPSTVGDSLDRLPEVPSSVEGGD
jgi:hypothetical protein